MDISDIVHWVCLGLCAIHALISWISSFRLGKKVIDICNKCGSPVVDQEKHDCFSLSTFQLTALEQFIKSIKEDK